MTYDLVIIGGGPAGAAAAVYAARKQLSTLLITEEWGGQSTVSTDIQNWIGTPSLSGTELAKDLETHVKSYAADIVHIHERSRVTDVTVHNGLFSVSRTEGEAVMTRAVLVTSGSRRRQLQVPGADTFEHKGVTYCASCDGPMFSGQDVVVVGGGNAGFESAAQLLAYAKSVTLLHRGERFKADPITVEKVLAHSNMTGIHNAEPTAIHGDQFVSGVTYQDRTTGTEHELAVTGVFVEIGMIPNTGYVADLVDLDEHNRIKIDPWTQKTSMPGVWAAGDCTNVYYHQNNIAAGDGVRALEDIYLTLKTK